MGSNSSFYQDGLPISSDNGGVGNVPAGAPAPKTAESSFYLSGSVYETLLNSDTLLAEIEADLAAAQAAATASEASNVASGVSAASAAASAAAAIVTLSTSLLKANNLSDLTNVATAKTNLSLVKADVGLGNVDNTSDVNKPVSTAQATAIALKSNIASPTFTGVPAAPTAAPATNTTQLATTAFVEAARVILAAADALKAPLASPTLTGTPLSTTAAPGTNTTQIATTAFVEAARVILAAADALKAPLASPTLTGTPAAPTATAGTNTTQLATTAFVEAARVILVAADALKAPLASPALTGTPTAPTAAGGTNTTQIATTAFVTAAVGGAGVSSIAGNTGAFTLSGGITNATNAIKLSLANATLQTSPAAPTSTTSTTGVMMGLGSSCTLTPSYSGRVEIKFRGWGYNTVAGSSTTFKVRYGTGTAPANGAAFTGTQVGGTVLLTAPVASYGVPFDNGGIITGLSPGTAYWFDIDLSASANTAGIGAVSCTAMEF